jgi:putative holliday junction resolvase
MSSTQNIKTVIALDIGMVRTGVAIANNIARIARPLKAIETVIGLTESVSQIVKEHNVVAVIIGLPRSLRGTDTDQTRYVREQADDLRKHLSTPLYFSDEALTSVQAEDELKLRKKPYSKEDVDMLAAVYILEDFISHHPEVYEND